MKKSLLNYKSLNYGLLLLLLCANSIYSQTVFEETFGAAAVAAPFTGGTSTPSVTYTQTGGTGAISTVLNSGNTYLNMVTTSASKSAIYARPTITGVLPTSPTGLNAVLSANDKSVTWSVNLKTNRLGTNGTTSYAEGKYFMAVVLCASNSGILGSTTPTGSDGYAIVYQKNTVTGTQPSVSLIKFHNGIGNSSTTVDAQELCTATRLIESPALAVIPVTATYAALSVKVVYNPISKSWELLYREDPGTAITDAFVDPTTGTLTSAGSSADSAYTGTTMTNFGFISGVQDNNAYKFQYDNFKISLSTPAAFTASPTVEKRQAFNSTPTPTVANLVAKSDVGGTFKWYDALTGGTLLSSSTPLSYANYYVSQTVNGTESTRVATQVFVGNTTLKTLPFYENFDNYIIDDKLILMNFNSTTGVGLGSWTLTPSTNVTDDVVIKANSPTGNGIGFVGSGIDPELKFTPTTTGNLFSSFTFTAVDPNDGKTTPASLLVNAQVAFQASADADYIKANPGALPPYPVVVLNVPGIDVTKSTPTGIYSFYFETTDPLTSVVSSGYASSVMFRKNIATGTFNLGLSKSNNGGECVWSDLDYSFGTKYTIVISYENIGDAPATSQVANLWVNPDTTSKPIPTLTQSTPTTSVTRSNIDRIKLLQASSTSTPSLVIDDIRVATTWDSTVVLGLQQVSKSQCTVYPNPVSNGKLYISSPSNSQKQVAIYSILGQKVLEAKTSNNAEINVSKLAKGNYILKITEDGKSDAKKLIIQ